MNIYEQQAANKRSTMLIVGAFVLLFAAIGFGADVFLLGYPVAGINDRTEQAQPYTDAWGNLVHPVPGPKETAPFATFIALVIAGGFILNSFNNGVGMVLRSTGARRLDPQLPQERQLYNVVEEMSIASGRKMPRIYVVPNPDPNAFATGFGEDDACIAVTEGLLKTLDRNELQAVVAHEMSHIHNLDIRLMTVVAGLGGALVLLADFASRSLFYGRRSRNSNNNGGAAAILFVVWLLLVMLAPLLVRVMSMAISRSREFLADATAAEFTRDPMSLVSALKKIRAAASPTQAIGKGVAHMCIEDPRGASFSDGEGFFQNLFSTHPPMARRIAALERMAMQNGSYRNIAVQTQEKPEEQPDKYGF